MPEDSKLYTQDEVDALRHQWEAVNFELQTKEVLASIKQRLDESNNYKATIGKDVKDIRIRIEVIEAARAAEVAKVANRRNWWQDHYVRVGIGCAILYEIINTAHLLHWV